MQGPASMTVTGTTLPASSKICVMPTFLPMMAFFIYISSFGYWLKRPFVRPNMTLPVHASRGLVG